MQKHRFGYPLMLKYLTSALTSILVGMSVGAEVRHADITLLVSFSSNSNVRSFMLDNSIISHYLKFRTIGFIIKVVVECLLYHW